jgi:hypothetical protein
VPVVPPQRIDALEQRVTELAEVVRALGHRRRKWWPCGGNHGPSGYDPRIYPAPAADSCSTRARSAGFAGLNNTIRRFRSGDDSRGRLFLTKTAEGPRRLRLWAAMRCKDQFGFDGSEPRGDFPVFLAAVHATPSMLSHHRASNSAAQCGTGRPSPVTTQRQLRGLHLGQAGKAAEVSKTTIQRATQKRLTALLTDQRLQPTARRGWWRRLFGEYRRAEAQRRRRGYSMQDVTNSRIR